MPLVPRQLRPRTRTANSYCELPVAVRVQKPSPPRREKLQTAFAFGVMLLLSLVFSSLGSGVKVRDMAMVAGARENQLVGYGLVVGLAGDGDKDQVYTKQSVANMLMRHGINIPAATLSAKNVAVVMVTADIGPFLKNGARIDVNVASMGDAKSLNGGVLLQTPLIGADGKVYAVAQGPLVVGGFAAGDSSAAGGAAVTKNHPTTAQIPGGALVEREIPTQFVRDNTVELLLRNASFGSAAAMAAAINAVFTNSAHAMDSSTVKVQMPEGTEASPVEFIARLNTIEVTPDLPARIIINERTGTIVATADIRISSCAVACGNITISVAQSLDVSQPGPFSNGTTAVTPRTDMKVTENKSSLVPLPELPTVEKVASALTTLGATPRDMMSIFQAMKQAGALQAELVVR